MATGLSLTDLLDADLRSWMVTSTKDAEARVAAVETTAQSFEQDAGIYKELGQLSGVVKLAEQTDELRRQNEVLRVVQAVGVDPTTGANRIVERLGKLEQANLETESALDEYNRLEGMSFFDNPIEYIKAEIYGKDEAKEKLTAAASKAKLYSEQLATTNNLVQESIQTTMAVKQGLNTEVIAATTRATQLAADLEANKAYREAVRWRAEKTKIWNEAEQARVSVLFTAVGNQRAQESLELQRQSAAREAAMFNINMQRAKDEREARAAGVNQMNFMLAKINEAGALIGKPQISMEAMRVAMDNPGLPSSQEVLKLYEMGTKMGAGTFGVIGAKPSQAWETIKTLTPNLNPVANKTASLLFRAEEALAKEAAKNMNLDPSKKETAGAREKWMNDWVQREVARQASEITPNSGNLFDLGDIRAQFSVPSIASLPVVKNYLAPMAQAGVDMSDPRAVIGLVNKGLKDKKITTAEAAGIAEIYQRGFGARSEQLMLKEMGIVPPQFAYNVRVPTGATFGDRAVAAFGVPVSGSFIGQPATQPYPNYDEVLNIADSVQLTRYFSRALGQDATLLKGAPK